MEIKINSAYFQGDKTIMSGIMSSVDGDICHFTFGVPGDKSTLSDSDKVKALLDMMYSSLYPNRAEKEAISDLRQEIDKINTESFTALKEENNALLSKAVADLTLLITESINTIMETLSVEEEEEHDTKESEGDI